MAPALIGIVGNDSGPVRLFNIGLRQPRPRLHTQDLAGYFRVCTRLGGIPAPRRSGWLLPRFRCVTVLRSLLNFRLLTLTTVAHCLSNVIKQAFDLPLFVPPFSVLVEVNLDP